MNTNIQLNWNSVAKYETDIFDFISDEKRDISQNNKLLEKFKSVLITEEVTVGDILTSVLKVDPGFKSALSYEVFFHYADMLSYHEKGMLGAYIACLSLKGKYEDNLVFSSLVDSNMKTAWNHREMERFLKKQDMLKLVTYIASKPEAIDYFHLIELKKLESNENAKFIPSSTYHQHLGELDVLVASVQNNSPKENRQKEWQDLFNNLYLQWLCDNRDRTVNCLISNQEKDSILHGYQQVSIENKAKLLMDVVNESLEITEENPHVKKAFSFPRIAWGLLSDMDSKLKEIDSSVESPLDYCNKDEITQDKVFVMKEHVKGLTIEISTFKLANAIAMWEVGNQRVRDIIPFMDGYQKPHNNVTATTNLFSFFNYIKRKHRNEVNCEYMEIEYSQNIIYRGKFNDKNYEMIFTSNNKDILKVIKEMLPDILLYKEVQPVMWDVIWEAKFESLIMRADLEKIEQSKPVQNMGKRLKF